MSEIMAIILGITLAFLTIIIGYVLQVFIKMHNNKVKIRNTLIQIKGQVDIKYKLLKEYVDINKDSILEDKLKTINEKLNDYNLYESKDINSLKTFNSLYVEYMKSFDDSLLNKQCDESEDKINYIKDYYNELVSNHNSYKSNGLSLFLSKAFSLEDEKTY